MNTTLQFACCHLTFVIRESGALPAFKGSTWHGIIGSRLKRLFCLYPQIDCNNCSLRPSCGYIDLYEPHMRSFTDGTPSSFPKGFVLHGLTDYRKQFHPGEHLSLGLVLIGRMNKYLPLLLENLREPFRIGKIPFLIELAEVRQSNFARFNEVSLFRDGQMLQAPEKPFSIGQFFAMTSMLETPAVQLEFLTPTRMKNEGRLNRTPEFEHIVKALVRKLNSFSTHYGDGEEVFSYDHYKNLIDASRSLETAEDTLQWVDWKRYSRRSQETITLGGFRGTLVVRGEQLKPILPLLLLGEYMHVGKQASFGLGQYACKFIS